MKRIIVLLICITFYSSFAQKNDYSYFYKLQLGNQPSSCYIEGDTLIPSYNIKDINTEDSLISLINRINYETTIRLLDSDLNSIFFPVNVNIINSNGDTLNFITDKDGMVKDLKIGCYNKIMINNLPYTPISIYLSIEQLYIGDKLKLIPPKKVTIILGKAHKLTTPEVFSKRPLSDKELMEIINDLSNGKESKLVKDKTCYITYEI